MKHLKTGSAFYASAAVCEMVDLIVLDEKRVPPVAARLQAEYGIDGIFMGVPGKLGASGLEQVIEVELMTPTRPSSAAAPTPPASCSGSSATS